MRGLVKVQIISKGPCSHRFCPSGFAYFCLLYEWLKKKKTKLVEPQPLYQGPLLLDNRETSKRGSWERGWTKPLWVRQT